MSRETLTEDMAAAEVSALSAEASPPRPLSTSAPLVPVSVSVPGPVLWPAFAATREAGYLTGTEERLTVTPLGRTELEKLVVAVQAWLAAELADWGAADDVQLHTALTGLARRLVDDDPQPLPLLSSPDTQQKDRGQLT